MNETMLTRGFLIMCGVGLMPVALGYGAAPSVTMNALYGISIDDVGLTHIMRAMMCLYLGMASLWLAGAFKPALTSTALLGCGVFMLSIATGRLLSVAMDGMPHWLFVLFTGLELVLGSLALILYRARETGSPSPVDSCVCCWP